MTLPTPDPDYLRTLHAATMQPPLRPRVPLWSGAVVVGSVEPDFLNQIVLPPLLDGRRQLSKKSVRVPSGAG